MPSASTVIYTIPPPDYFWKWSTDDSAVEWADGTTLALREEVITVLENLAPHGGIPPLGALLLVIASCNGDAHKAIASFQNSFPESERTSPTSVANKFSSGIEEALTGISELPKELRYGLRAKTQLCQALFSRSEISHKTEAAEKIIFELIAETPSQWHNEQPYYKKEQRLLRDGKTILNCCAQLSTTELSSLIETGIEFDHLEAAELTEPRRSSENNNRPLLDLLDKENKELKGIASLAKKVISFLSVPRPAIKEEELRIGGVSDIINRGTPDRLLTSELAWDDLSLAIRLAHNEALYYRRETPPDKATTERIILLDHGLRYWGILRLYAHAILLGLTTIDKDRRGLAIRCYCTNQNEHSALSILNVSDVKKALAQLPIHLDPAPSLHSLYEDLLLNPPEGIPDVFFIVTEASIAEIDAKNALSSLANLVRKYGGHFHLILIDPVGGIRDMEHLGGQMKLLKKGHIDLDDILLITPPALPLKNKDPRTQTANNVFKKPNLEKATGTPFYNHYPPPLLFLSQPKGIINYIEEKPNGTYLGVDSNKRLLRWFTNGAPAQELCSVLPGRDHWVYKDPAGELYVTCSAQTAGESAQFFKIKDDGTYETIPTCKPKHSFPSRATFSNRAVILSYINETEAISLDTGKSFASIKHPRRNISDKKFRLSADGLSISSETRQRPSALDFFGSKNGLQEDPQPRIKPTKIAIASNGRIILYTKEKIFFFSTSRWTAIKSHPSYTIVASATFVEQSLQHSKSEPKLLQAQLGPIIATLDPRSILHISDRKNAWSIGLYEGSVSIWNEDSGTVALSDKWTAANNEKPLDSKLVEIGLIEMLKNANYSVSKR